MSDSNNTTTTRGPDNPIIKPAIGAVVACALDKFVFKNNNDKNVMYLGAAVGLGFFAAPYLAQLLPLEKVVSSVGNDNGASAELRICEVGLGLGSVYVLEEYVLKQKIAEQDLGTKMMIIVGADFISEYISDYLSQKPLQFVAGSGL